jgi:hypothetical protein
VPLILLTTAPQSFTHLTSPEEVKELLCAIKHRNEIALEIEFLEVSANAFEGSAFKSVREILYCTRNITDLVLRLPFKPIHILPTAMALNRLTSLDVNFAHTAVAQLLRTYPFIENLTLGPCSNALRCPLTNCFLPSLKCLTCPPSCVRALTANSPVNWLAATYDGVQYARFPILQLLDFRPIPTCASLTILHIDFDHTAERLLLRISSAAPALVHLKLTESSSSFEVLYLLCDVVRANVAHTVLRSRQCHGTIRRVGKLVCGPFYLLSGYCCDRGAFYGRQSTWRIQ